MPVKVLDWADIGKTIERIRFHFDCFLQVKRFSEENTSQTTFEGETDQKELSPSNMMY